MSQCEGWFKMTEVIPNVTVGVDPDYVERVISFNVKVLLAAKGHTQADLAGALGLTRSAASYKLSGKSVWSVPDVVRTANFLETTPEVLMDDSLMQRMGVSDDAEADMEKSAGNGGLSGESTPRGIRTHNPRLKRIIPLTGQ